MTFLEETKSFIEKLQSSIAVDSDNSLLLDVAIGKFIALNEQSDIDRIEAKEIDKHLIKLQIKLESKRRDNDLIFHPYEEISKLIALASIENISDSAALGIANNLIYQCSSQSITIPSYIHEVIDDSIRELITKFKKPLQTTRAAASTISTEAHELAESLLCNDENNIYTNAYDEYLILLCEKRNTILNDLRKAFKSNEVGDNEILRKIKDFTNINLMVYEEDINHNSKFNRLKSSLKHNSLLFELTNDFEALYLEGEIDFLKRIEGLLSNELSELKDHYNMGVSFWKRRAEIEKNESYSKNIDYYKTILDYKSDYIDEALSALSKFTNSTTNTNRSVDVAEATKTLNINNFDSSDETNPLIFDRDLINGLHNNFRNFIFKTTDIDTFENYFREKPLKIEKKDGISISVICYLFGKIEPHQNGVENFARWMKNHIGKTSYGSKKKEFIEMAESAKIKRSGFSLTAPQLKALQNKEKIDVLFNRMNPDL